MSVNIETQDYIKQKEIQRQRLNSKMPTSLIRKKSLHTLNW